jgi:mRNA interferase YafQ
MRATRTTKRFDRDFKRELTGVAGKELDRLLNEVRELLAADQRLPFNRHDHALSGEWKDHRECHLRPNLLLVYRKPDGDTLELVRLGSHAELF